MRLHCKVFTFDETVVPHLPGKRRDKQAQYCRAMYVLTALFLPQTAQAASGKLWY